MTLPRRHVPDVERQAGTTVHRAEPQVVRPFEVQDVLGDAGIVRRRPAHGGPLVGGTPGDVGVPGCGQIGGRRELTRVQDGGGRVRQGDALLHVIVLAGVIGGGLDLENNPIGFLDGGHPEQGRRQRRGRQCEGATGYHGVGERGIQCQGGSHYRARDTFGVHLGKGVDDQGRLGARARDGPEYRVRINSNIVFCVDGGHRGRHQLAGGGRGRQRPARDHLFGQVCIDHNVGGIGYRS